MPTRLVHVVVDAADPGRLARFWAAVLGWEVPVEEPGEVVIAPPGYEYPDPVAQTLAFIPVPGLKTVKNRVHLDLATESAEHQAAEVSRLRDLGARPADIGQGEVPWVVLADLEGNEFCVLDPRPAYRDTGPVAAVVADCADPPSLAGFWELAAGFARTGSSDGWGRTWSCCGSRTSRRSRTGCTSTSPRTRARTRPPTSGGCRTRAPRLSTSARATSAGPCLPTPKAASSAC
jgi:Glyoxalase-like domain